jgi:hypothetical protein
MTGRPERRASTPDEPQDVDPVPNKILGARLQTAKLVSYVGRVIGKSTIMRFKL